MADWRVEGEYLRTGRPNLEGLRCANLCSPRATPVIHFHRAPNVRHKFQYTGHVKYYNYLQCCNCIIKIFAISSTSPRKPNKNKNIILSRIARFAVCSPNFATTHILQTFLVSGCMAWLTFVNSTLKQTYFVRTIFQYDAKYCNIAFLWSKMCVICSRIYALEHVF